MADAEKDSRQRGSAKERILQAALELFAEHGYTTTTMRSIAARAEVAPSHAYYYFSGKEELVQALYERIQHEHRERAAEALATRGPLAERLKQTVHRGLDVIADYHDFGTAFVSTAIAPGSAANPLSARSAPARDLSLAIFTEVVAGAQPPVPARIRDQLPRILWLCWLGTVLFWVGDDSSDQRRTRELVDAAIPPLLAMVALARLPMTGKLVDHLERLLSVLLPQGSTTHADLGASPRQVGGQMGSTRQDVSMGAKRTTR